MLPVLTWSSAISTWQLRVVMLTLTLAAAGAYGVLVVRVERRGVRWPRWRIVSWLLALLVIVESTQGGVAVYGDVLFWVHMVEHLALIMIAPICLVLGAPVSLLVAASSDHGRPRVERWLSRGIVSGVTHPVVGLVVYGLTIVLTHLTGFMNAMMLHPWLEVAEQLLYLGAGTLFFLPLLGSEPLRWRLRPALRVVILLLSMPIDTFTGIVLIQTTHYPWPAMAAMHQSWAPTALDDLYGGGAVMWIGGDGLMALVAAAACFAWVLRHRDDDLGPWLEGVRLRALQERTGSTLLASTAIDSDASLDAYNAYLARLNSPDRSNPPQ